MKKISNILFTGILLILFSCQEPIYEFPYESYLGQWKDSISGVTWQFNQSELYIGQSKYQFWDVSHDSLILKQEPNKLPVAIFKILKEPYYDKNYTHRMVIKNTTTYYLKEL